MRRFVPCLLLLIVLSGCQPILDLLFPNPPNGGEETGSAKLLRFASEQEMVDYFRGQMTVRNDGLRSADEMAPIFDAPTDSDPALPGTGDSATGGAPPSAVPEDGSAGADDGFSGTTTQESGVDEADVVKTDGTYLYILDSSTLRIIQATPPEALAVVAELPLEGYGRELYLYGDKVVALTEVYGGFYYGGIGIEPLPAFVDVVAGREGEAEAGQTSPPAEGDTGTTDDGSSVDDGTDSGIVEGDMPEFARPQTVVTIVDVSDRAAPRLISSTAFDGTKASSRMIDGMLHLVIGNYQYYYYDVFPMLGRPEFAAPTVEAEVVLPSYERTAADGSTTSGPVLTWEDVYRPTDPDGFGVVSVVSLDVDSPEASFSAKGIVAEPGLVYASLEALYLTDTNYDFFGNLRETTDIYKYDYVPGGTEPAATGSVSGRVLNQYSMGENQGFLRVATTVGPTFSPTGEQSGPHNNVYVLEEQDGALSVVGSVEDIAPRETIQSARFLGNRGYVVTFEQIDPLFTLDLSDPRAPRIVGELKVPGFSTFLTPIDENHVLAVGQYIPEGGFFWGGGVQLTIFDVTDFANPVQSFNVVIGEQTGAYSEALYDPKALTYYARDGLVALPVSYYDFAVPVDDVIVGDDGTTADGEEVVSSPPMPVEPTADTGEGEPGSDGSTGTGTSDGTTEPGDVVDPYIPPGFDGVYVYRVSAEGGIDELGRISTRFKDAGYYYGGAFTRGVFIGQNVFAVTNFGVRGAPVSDLTAAPYELLTADEATYDDTDFDDVGAPTETKVEPAPMVP